MYPITCSLIVPCLKADDPAASHPNSPGLGWVPPLIASMAVSNPAVETRGDVLSDSPSSVQKTGDGKDLFLYHSLSPCSESDARVEAPDETTSFFVHGIEAALSYNPRTEASIYSYSEEVAVTALHATGASKGVLLVLGSGPNFARLCSTIKRHVLGLATQTEQTLANLENALIRHIHESKGTPASGGEAPEANALTLFVKYGTTLYGCTVGGSGLFLCTHEACYDLVHTGVRASELERYELGPFPHHASDRVTTAVIQIRATEGEHPHRAALIVTHGTTPCGMLTKVRDYSFSELPKTGGTGAPFMRYLNLHNGDIPTAVEELRLLNSGEDLELASLTVFESIRGSSSRTDGLQRVVTKSNGPFTERARAASSRPRAVPSPLQTSVSVTAVPSEGEYGRTVEFGLPSFNDTHSEVSDDTHSEVSDDDSTDTSSSSSSPARSARSDESGTPIRDFLSSLEDRREAVVPSESTMTASRGRPEPLAHPIINTKGEKPFSLGPPAWHPDRNSEGNSVARSLFALTSNMTGWSGALVPPEPRVSHVSTPIGHSRFVKPPKKPKEHSFFASACSERGPVYDFVTAQLRYIPPAQRKPSSIPPPSFPINGCTIAGQS